MAEVASKINATDLNAFLIDIILGTTKNFLMFGTFWPCFGVYSKSLVAKKEKKNTSRKIELEFSWVHCGCTLWCGPTDYKSSIPHEYLALYSTNYRLATTYYLIFSLIKSNQSLKWKTKAKKKRSWWNIKSVITDMYSWRTHVKKKLPPSKVVKLKKWWCNLSKIKFLFVTLKWKRKQKHVDTQFLIEP